MRRLTLKTRLNILRKDVKRWHRALRTDDTDSRRRPADARPKAPAKPTLRDVQQALACKYGCESWVALKVAVDDLALDRKTHAERVDQPLLALSPAARRILARYPDIARDNARIPTRSPEFSSVCSAKPDRHRAIH